MQKKSEKLTYLSVTSCYNLLLGNLEEAKLQGLAMYIGLNKPQNHIFE